MSPGSTGAQEAGAAAAARALLRRPGRLIWLWAVWMMLWGRPTPLTAISGVVVAAAVLLLFPLRADADATGRFRPLPALALLGRLLVDLVPSALSVAKQMIVHGPRTRSAIIEVPLTVSSEVVATLTANAISLAPGAFVLEADHEAGTMYVYVLAAEDDRTRAAVRASVQDMQHRVLDVFGGDERTHRERAPNRRRRNEEEKR
ncbi:multisubunit sodium/proton antiporter, MrpE subunit [Frankia sp. EI5c]|uniref:Na+/H+ antiporter subunit E n=1 Tax=Frankia sp. EI5c TaxID=683316 RepID=UPI0007C220C6|nr:Na+/H+ antiporter subunit E [Frankia sp. EI5c]OAA28761.1 multisubunit sodium/proton antiporter, MrpE subunit [Frankia sp. EI5c]